ncbi:MAG: hypothetical protein JO250_01475 [Armatimonadetes bacterium]|nr:hypothetical protein [Armatimonadota bacterium]
MTLFTGVGARPGVALAAAARLRVEYGVASLDPERLRRIATRLRAFGVESPEPEQVILVADTVPPGFTPAAAGLEVVGVAAGSDAPLIPAPDVPAVIELGDEFFASVAEDEIVIVDGSRGRVYLSPDAETIARYQSPGLRARRIFLDGEHLPARTASDGRTVSVFAPAVSPGDVERAMGAGADGLFLYVENSLLGNEAAPMTASEQTAALQRIVAAIGGLPLLLHVPPERLALTALARASADGPIHLFVGDAATRAEIADRLTEIEAVYEEEDVRFGTPQFELALPSADTDAPLPETLDGFAGVFAAEALSEARTERLLLIAGLAERARKPLLLALGDDWPSELPTALSLGSSRLLVPAAAVPDVKDAIRAW